MIHDYQLQTLGVFCPFNFTLFNTIDIIWQTLIVHKYGLTSWLLEHWSRGRVQSFGKFRKFDCLNTDLGEECGVLGSSRSLIAWTLISGKSSGFWEVSEVWLLEHWSRGRVRVLGSFRSFIAWTLILGKSSELWEVSEVWLLEHWSRGRFRRCGKFQKFVQTTFTD